MTKTERMLQEHMNTYDLSCPYDNMYQGVRGRLLFVCSAGMLRSPTAANVATKSGYNARSCGSATYALIPLSVNLIHWANKIYFMNEENSTQALEVFYGDRETCDMIKSKMVVWEIEDVHDFMDPTLVRKIEELLV